MHLTYQRQARWANHFRGLSNWYLGNFNMLSTILVFNMFLFCIYYVFIKLVKLINLCIYYVTIM